MPQLRAPDGAIVTVPDEQAGQLIAGGYTPVDVSEAAQVTAARERPTSGALAPIGAGASSFLSGATLGLSDVALKGLLDPEAFARLAADREDHPIVSGAGQLAGTLVGGPTPAGALNEATAAASAGRGVAARIAADAGAGAIYNAGAYLSDSALGDRELSAEGLRASLGAGFEFGAAGGVAALGLEKGTIAARRMFSRLADGTDRVANEAEQAWRAKYQATIDANDAAADAARVKLAEAQHGRMQAQLAQQRAAAGLADARAGVPVPGEAPGGVGGVPVHAPAGAAPGGPTAVPGQAPTGAPMPPQVEAAGLLRDRAAQITDTQVQRWDAANGARLRELTGGAAAPGGLPPALQALADRTGVITRGPAERELAAALAEHDAARADLDDLLQRLEVPDVGQPGGTIGGPAVPVGEFGAPGARGIKGPETLGRLAAGTGAEEGAQAADLADVTGAGGPRALRAQGTPVEQPATAVGKRSAAAGPEPAAAPATSPIPTYEHLKTQPDAIVTTVPASVIKERGWYEMPGQGADAVKAERGRATMREGQRDPIKITVGQDGKLFVEDGRNRLNAAVEQDKPIKVRWDYGTARGEAAGDVLKGGPASAGGDDLFAALSGTKSAIDKGAELADIGGKEAAATRAEQLMRHPDTAERFLARAGASDAAANLRAKATGDDLDAFFRDLTAPKTRDAYVAANIQRAMREEGSHAAALAKVEREWAERTATEAWAERAAVLEYEGGYSRAEAERIARDEVEKAPHGPGSESPPVWESKKNLKRTEAAKKAAAASVERLHEIHSAVASNLPQELQTAWNEEGYKFLRDESARIRGIKDRISAASKISEAFTEQYGAPSETLRGYEGDRFHRRAEIEAKHAESWANEQERKHYAEAAARRHLGAAPETAPRHPLSVRQLEAAHDAAVERAATATEPTERAAAAADAKAITEQLTAVGRRPGAVEDVAAAVPVVTRYERAGARLAEALGDEAPPAAKEAAQAFRAAEDEADRKVASRATRAIDDHVTAKQAAGPAPTSAAEWNQERIKRGLGDALAPPAKPGAGPRVAAAKAEKLRADAGLAHARAAETEARIGATTAKRTADEYRAAAEAAWPAAPASAEPSRLGSILTAVAAAGELGIPGIPRPHDIPVIGPLLSLWTKYRIAKAMVGRFAGRVAATGDARAAALAARAKDKVAAAVDRTLGLAAEAAPKARAPIVAAAAVLGPRLIDDGEPDAKRGANAQEVAAVRIREISAAVARPDLVSAMVRGRLGPVADPDLIAAAEQVLQRQFAYLAGVMPKLPPSNPYSKTQFVPSPGAAADLADRIGVLHDPTTAFQSPTPAKADALANFYPKLFAFAQQRLAERAADLEHPMDYRQQLTASLILRVPVVTSMQPGNMALLQSAHVAIRAAMQPAAETAAPTSSVAQPTNLNTMYQTSADRRAAR